MKNIVFSLLFSGISFIIFLVILIVGLTRKRKNIILISVFIFVISLAFGIWSIYTVTRKTYHKISEAGKSRNGEEIYESLLGKPETNCVEIIDYQDQIIPRIDDAIYLHFKTCPEELERILKRKHFQSEKITAKNLFSEQVSANKNWFTPEKLGDSILVFKYYDEKNKGQEIYSSTDSTEVYLKDIAD